LLFWNVILSYLFIFADFIALNWRNPRLYELGRKLFVGIIRYYARMGMVPDIREKDQVTGSLVTVLDT
jgi:hypothetical protein